MKRVLMGMCAAGVVLTAAAFEYDVRQPGDVLRPKWSAADTAPGVWTLNVADALAKAQSAGKCTVVLNTASWWCPYCETLESTVLGSEAWRDYVRECGLYLAMLDFPYRNPVPEDQLWKSRYPELGTGWGFDCWMMCPEYLAEIGLTKEQGLDAIMDMYRLQRDLALESATPVVISNWQQTAEFTYGKVGYPTLIVFGPDGNELGRTGFPWYRTADVTPSEAQEYVIQAIDQIVNGSCSLCEDPLSGTPPGESAQKYVGWFETEDSGLVGLVEVKTTKATRNGQVSVSACVTFKGLKVSLGSKKTYNLDEYIPFARKNISLSVKLGEVGMGGEVYVDGVRHVIGGGGRDVFTAKDDLARRRAANVFEGCWNLVLKPSDSKSPSAFARGYGALTVKVGAKGKATISGYMGDGTRVTAVSKVIFGEDGRACLPVLESLYSRKGGFGFVIWFVNDRIYSIANVAPWVSGGKNEFTAKYVPSFTMSSGYGEIQDELELTLGGFDPTGRISGGMPAEDPSEDIVSVRRTTWVGEATGFKTGFSSRTGALKGYMPFQVQTDGGTVRKVKGKFYGVVMGGSGYGTVIVPDTGSWPVKIAVCGGCSD